MIDVVTNVIVGASLLSGLVFAIAWAVRPGLRRRVEAPKHRFLEAVERYDRRHTDMTDRTR